MTERHIAIVLAGGRGSRMNSDIPKQYMQIMGKPVLYYSLLCFQNSFIDDIILVCGESDIDYCQKEIVDRYGLDKVRFIVAGGQERYNSVYNGICIAEKLLYGEVSAVMCGVNSIGKEVTSAKKNKQGYIYIHDGARACVNEMVLEECRKNVILYKACIPSVSVKDTIKIADDSGFVKATPARKQLMAVQTPQTFEYELVKTAYDRLYSDLATGKCNKDITDDAMVVEEYTDTKIKFCQGNYENIKITTPEDMDTAEKNIKKMCLKPL